MQPSSCAPLCTRAHGATASSHGTSRPLSSFPVYCTKLLWGMQGKHLVGTHVGG